MINDFNRKQTLLGIVNILVGLVAFAVAAAFFYFVSQFVLTSFGVENSKAIGAAITALGLLVVFFSGLKLHRKGDGNYGYQDSALMPGFQLETAGSTVVDFYTNRVTAPAHALTQIFLCGPLQLLKGIDRLRSRIQHSPALEQILAELLSRINDHGKWQAIADYPGQSAELQYLIRMDAIQFSGRTGKLRSKS